MKILGIIIALLMLFTVVGCDDDAQEPAVLQTVEYCGTGTEFGSHVGDTLTLTFSSGVLADGTDKVVRFVAGTLLWQRWGDPPMKWEVSGNVLTITATSVFSAPRAIIGDRVIGVTGLNDAAGNAATVPDGGILVGQCP